MFCSKCGSKVEEDASFCGDCGNQLRQVRETTSDPTPSLPVTGRANRSLRLPLIIGAVAILVLAAAGALYLLKDSGLGVIGGGGGLSRGKAKRLIEEELSRSPITDKIVIGRKQYGVPMGGKDKSYEETVEEEYRNAVAQGLMTVKLVEKFRRMLWWDIYEFQLTDKAKPFVLKKGKDWAELKLADKVVVDVTGITAPSDALGQKMSAANFTYKLQPTPAGEVFIDKKRLNELHQDSAAFTLYDDGWRLTR